MDPANYRGIALASCIGKLFNSILYTRINHFLEIHKLIRPEQGGFRKDYRTSDHIFTLQTIVEKYIKEGTRVYTVFVDLKKAYDSVWREGLIHKLNKIGLEKKLVNIIADKYRETYTSIIHKGLVLPKISTNKGVIQGDNLSPLLFNIYVNDLPRALEVGKTNPIRIMDRNLNSLMWADDIILMSETREGLQQCINNLQDYCQEWKLEINLKKTKTIIFNKSGAKLKNLRLYLQNKLIENVTQYPYLGFIVAASGTLKHGIQNLVDKAKRAWFAIQSILIKSKEKNVKTYTTLFDKVIKPIILYSCEIWGKCDKMEENTENIGKTIWERFHLRACKNIIGAHKRASNIATLAEIGRYPIGIEIHKRMIRYLLRMKNVEEERFLYSAFLDQQKGKNKINNWVTKTKEILDKSGYSFIFKIATDKEKTLEPKEIKPLSNKIQKREEEIFEQKLFCLLEEKRINKEGKLVFYANLKKKFGQEKYLRLKNIKNRNTIRDIRMSTHNLSIERGRYEGTPKELRLCLCCTGGKIESEEHFILECENYKEERLKFSEFVFGENKGINLKKLQEVFQQNDLKCLNELGKFLKECGDKRTITILLQELLQKVGNLEKERET